MIWESMIKPPIAVLVIVFAASAQETQVVMKQYCITCHNSKLKTGGLALDKLDLAHVAPDAETWEKVSLKLRAGMMPPAGAPRPGRATGRRTRPSTTSPTIW